MEQNDSAFIAAREKKRRQKRIRSWIVSGVAAMAVVIAVILLYTGLSKGESDVSVEEFRAVAVSEGEIKTTISGSGTLSALEQTTATAAGDGRVEAVLKAPGETVAAGEPVLRLTSETIKSELDTLYVQLAAVQNQLAGTTHDRTNLNVTAPRAGIVKDIRAAAGDAAESFGYLCVIATDGKMKLTIDASEGVTAYREVIVDVDGTKTKATVVSVSDGKADILFEDAGYACGTPASAETAEGEALGSGRIEVSDHVIVRADAGCIDAVLVTENQKVAKGEKLFTLRAGAPTSAYETRKAKETELRKQIETLEDALTITSDFDGILAELSVQAGDEVAEGDALCVFTRTDGYTLQLSIDELDLASVQLGQAVEITLDALEGQSFSGRVTNLSYAGSGSYVTTYTATITTEPIAGAYPGMSASAEITTATSGTSLIIPVGTVRYENGQAYVLRAPETALEGERVPAEQVDEANLEHVSVTTGMSDGTYLVITAEGLSAGDLLYEKTLETTAVYTPDSDAVQFPGMTVGEMPGGGFIASDGGFEGRDFGGERPENGQRPRN